MKNFEDKDDLIAKVIAGEANGEEIALLEIWKNASVANLEYFTLNKKLLDTISSIELEHPVNINTAWNKLDERISNNATKVIPLYKRTTVIRIAASLMLIVALSFLMKWIFTGKEVQSLQYLALNKTVSNTLPDGSKVFLNKHSEITYSLNKDNVREVKLKGEAFFEVVHNEQQPFEIIINDVIIKDIGTAFNVKALPGTNNIEVVVESGEVHFFTSTDAGLNLVKGQKAIYNITAKQFVQSILDPSENAVSYHSKIFQFNQTPLDNVIKQINDVYDVNIALNDEALADKKLSVIFNNEPVDVVISIIAETLDLDIEKRDSSVILKSKTKVQ
ncbi:MAG: FecR domain-containing protein [Bacteroidetes bacterium]|nr:FecR domain-containing protein [Bacteroidota bacterium]